MPWNNIPKPTGANYTNIPKPTDGGTLASGAYMGPLGLTYSEDINLTNWNNINKPSGGTWNNISKPIN